MMRNSTIKYIVWGCVMVIITYMMYLIFIYPQIEINEGSLSPNEFGDAFGWITAIFTFLALFFTARALMLQTDQIKEQSKAIMMQKEELELQREEMKLQNIQFDFNRRVGIISNLLSQLQSEENRHNTENIKFRPNDAFVFFYNTFRSLHEGDGVDERTFDLIEKKYDNYLSKLLSVLSVLRGSYDAINSYQISEDNRNSYIQDIRELIEHSINTNWYKVSWIIQTNQR